MSVYKILICDIIAKGGHYITFNQYIIDNFLTLEQANPALHISFLYNSGAKELLNLNDRVKERVSFFEPSITAETTFSNKYRISKKLKRFAELYPVDHLIMLEFDKYQVPFFLINFPFAISGILFRPHHRITVENNSYGKALISRVNKRKKKFTDTLLVKNPAIKNIYVLNDTDGVQALNQIFKSEKFKFLPDPVFVFNAKPDIKSLDINKDDSYKFLVFGWLDERKNITNILNAYNAANFSYKTTLLLVGPARGEYIEYLNLVISELNAVDNWQKKIYIKPEYVSNEEMDTYFAMVDVCLFIYKDFFYSSGLIGRAALHQKKVIGTNVGVIEQITNKYQLGITCDPNNVGLISQALLSIKDHKLNPALCTDFYHEHSPEAFLSHLLNV